MGRTRRGAAALAVMVTAWTLLTAGAGAATVPPSRIPRATMTPIVAIHGIVLGTCPAMDSGTAMSGPIWYMWNNGEWNRPYDAISYFRCDVDGSDIGTQADNNTPIENIAHDLAWYLYTTYSSHGQTVEIVGHSMGGLIARAALQSFAAHDPTYPPKLLVQDVVTISAAFAGADFGCATTSYQCREMLPGSPFVTWLAKNQHPQGSNGTDWTTIGGSPCDLVPGSSSTAMTGSHRWLYYLGTPTCYDHTSYLWDSSTATDEAVRWAPPAGTHFHSVYAYHSQAAIMLAVDSASW